MSKSKDPVITEIKDGYITQVSVPPPGDDGRHSLSSKSPEPEPEAE
jgi:hypothetical protein